MPACHQAATPRRRSSLLPPLFPLLRRLGAALLALALLPAAAQEPAAGAAAFLQGKKVLVTGGSPFDAGLDVGMRRQLQEMGAGVAATVGANLLTEHGLRVEPFPGTDGDASDAALARRFTAGDAERLIVLLAVVTPDRRIDVSAQVFEVKLNALGALDNQRLWQGSTTVTFSQVATHAPWLAVTLIAYDLLDAMVAARLIAPPLPSDRLLADMLFDCSAIHSANALALEASGEKPGGQQALIDAYRASATAFSSPQYAAQKTAESAQAVRDTMAQVQSSPDADAAREYLAELDARIEHCARYQRRHLDLISGRLKGK